MNARILAGILAFSGVALAQSEPSPLIRLIRGEPVQGVDVARPYYDAGAGVTVLGMSSIAGRPETWMIEHHGSFESIETLDKALIASMPRAPGNGGPLLDDVLGTSRTIIALYRPGWSYRPDEALKNLPKARYFYVSVYRIRSGTEGEFSKLIRQRLLGLDSINLDRPEIAYQVITGGPSGTYFFLAPLTSLKTMDNALERMPVHGEGGSPSGKIAAETIISREHLLFRVEPRISRPGRLCVGGYGVLEG